MKYKLKQFVVDLSINSLLWEDKLLAHQQREEIDSLKMKKLAVRNYFEHIILNPRSRVTESENVAKYCFGLKHYKNHARRVRRWGEHYYKYQTFEVSKRGLHPKSESLINDEDVQIGLKAHLRTMKVESITAQTFARCADQYFILHNIERKTVSERTARRWLHVLGYEMWSYKQGIYVDGHERADVVAHRHRFLDYMETRERRMRSWAADSTVIPPLLHTLADGSIEKEVVAVVHDECCFNSYDGKRSVWADLANGRTPIRKKGRGESYMVSEFLCPCHGHLRITMERALELGLVRCVAREYVHVGARHEGYWDNKDVARQLKEEAIILFNEVHKNEDGICDKLAVFMFDNSSNHRSLPGDALVVTKEWPFYKASKRMANVMRNGWYENANGEKVVQPMQVDGVQRPICDVLRERGLYTGEEQPKMLRDDAVILLKEQPDFMAQRCWLQEICEDAGHELSFFPKFHCEFNWIERYWGAAKRWARDRCEYNFERLVELVPQALDAVALDTMRAFERKAYRYMDLYRNKFGGERLTPAQVEWSVKKFRSHRRISDFIFKEENGKVMGLAPTPLHVVNNEVNV